MIGQQRRNNTLRNASTTFTVPPRLFAGRKRRANANCVIESSDFFTPDDFGTFSVRGDAHRSRIYGELETRRQTLVTTLGTSNVTRRSFASMKLRKTTKHLVQLLAEAIEANQIQAPENMSELDDARRRISGFSIAEHAQYLKLQRKIVVAQKRGLPEVLALSQDEASLWQQMKKDVGREQVVFCRMMARGLAAEAAINETLVPAFAVSWYDAMLMQCWNDIYRLYPRWFEPSMAIEFPSGSVYNDSGCAVTKMNEVATRGSCCTIDLAKLVAGQPLKNDTEGPALDVASPRQVISTDPQAAQLMETYDCDVAISSSTLVTLFDSDTSANFAHVPADWGIPMKSQLGADGSIGATKKRIFLDRPLPGSNPCAREKIAEAGRAALLSRFESESVLEGSTGGRTAYQIWQLNDRRVLVRSTTQVNMMTPALSGGTTPSTNVSQDVQPIKHVSAPLSVFVKPDYQLLGVEEQLTTSERCRFWLHSWLRGGSAVLVARVNPKNGVISSWKTYSPMSLIYGDESQQCPPLECFEPSSKFMWLSMLFAKLEDVPVGNYLLRQQDIHGSSTFGKRCGGIEVLMATTESETNTSVVDLYNFMPKPNATEFITGMDTTSVLPAWNLSDRIPYTFQTGMYCLPFFLDGVCPNISKDVKCGDIHLRLPKQSAGFEKPVKTMRWHFDNYTNVWKKSAKSTMLHESKRVTLKYAFCGEDKAPPCVASLADLDTPVHCPQPPNKCSLPHFTLHQILERLADDLLRVEREKRRAQKNKNRHQGKTGTSTKLSSTPSIA